MTKKPWSSMLGAILVVAIFTTCARADVLYESLSINTSGGACGASSFPSLNVYNLLVDDITVPAGGWAVDSLSCYFSPLGETPTGTTAYLVVFQDPLGTVHPAEDLTVVPITTDMETFTDTETGTTRDDVTRITASDLNLTLEAGHYWVGLSPICETFQVTWMAWGSRVDSGEFPQLYRASDSTWSAPFALWSGPSMMLRIAGTSNLTYGSIEGLVTSCSSEGSPLEGVAVYVDGDSTTSTDMDGHYTLSQISTLPHELTFRYPGYYDTTLTDVQTTEGNTLEQDAVMTYPEGTASLDPIVMNVFVDGTTDSTLTASLELSNTGCGVLNWQAAAELSASSWANSTDDWFTLSATSGSLDPGESQTLQILVDVSAGNLGQVNYSVGDTALVELSFTGEPWSGLGPIGVHVQMVSPVNETVSQMPEMYALHPNFPNPFNPTTTIRFDLVTAQHVHLGVYNVFGQQVALLENGTMQAGYHTVTFDGSRLGSGVYFCRIETPAFSGTRKMILLK